MDAHPRVLAAQARMCREFPGETVRISESVDPENGGTYTVVVVSTSRGVDDALARLEKVFDWWVQEPSLEQDVVLTFEFC